MASFGRPLDVPRWVSLGLIPLINLILAFIAGGIVVLVIGEDPLRAVDIMLKGAFGSFRGLSYTLYYTTNFIFTGLSVAMAFHAGLFNIGSEGQAYIGGLGAGLACLFLAFLPWFLVIPIAIAASALFGAAWAFIPAWLQARRGSHVVITTIMFNFIASTLMVYLLVHVLIAPGQMSPESAPLAPNTLMPTISDVAAWFGYRLGRLPLNMSFLWALLCCAFVWIYIWHTRWGYAMRTVGTSPRAAVYGGIDVARVIIIAMLLSGALAGFVALNEVMGVQKRLLLNFVAGYGFVGIAVSLMGRNHPFGILLASLLFGALYQGGGELSFDMPSVTRDLVVVIQGLVILFVGGLENMFRPQIEGFFRARAQRRVVEGTAPP